MIFEARRSNRLISFMEIFRVLGSSALCLRLGSALKICKPERRDAATVQHSPSVSARIMTFHSL